MPHTMYCMYRWPDIWLLKLSRGVDWVAVRDIHAAELVSSFNKSLPTTTQEPVVQLENAQNEEEDEQMKERYYLRSERLLQWEQLSEPTEQKNTSEEADDGMWTVELAIGFTIPTPKPQLFSGYVELIFTEPPSTSSSSSTPAMSPLLPPTISTLLPPAVTPPVLLPDDTKHDISTNDHDQDHNKIIHYAEEELTFTTKMMQKVVIVMLIVLIIFFLTQWSYRKYCLSYDTIPDRAEEVGYIISGPSSSAAASDTLQPKQQQQQYQTMQHNT